MLFCCCFSVYLFSLFCYCYSSCLHNCFLALLALSPCFAFLPVVFLLCVFCLLDHHQQVKQKEASQPARKQANCKPERRKKGRKNGRTDGPTESLNHWCCALPPTLSSSDKAKPLKAKRQQPSKQPKDKQGKPMLARHATKAKALQLPGGTVESAAKLTAGGPKNC